MTASPSTPTTRRGLLRTGALTAAGAGAAMLGGPPAPAAAAPRPRGRRPGTSGVTLRWFGVNGWEIRTATQTVLIDPWITRFRTGMFSPSGIDPTTALRVDPATIDRYVTAADVILVGHGHFDHIPDVPYIAGKTDATVLGTASHGHALTALGMNPTQMNVVRGGEWLDFDSFSVSVHPALHSVVGKRRSVPFPGDLPVPAATAPHTIADLPDGGTLIYQITTHDGFSVFNMSTANFVTDTISGLRPDVAIVAVGGKDVHDYLGRLADAIGQPTAIVPTHWDDPDQPLTSPAADPRGQLAAFRDALPRYFPRSRLVVVDHLRTFTP
ncbi:MBL fold metallo-hydrolase [Actinoplanes sp. NPDC051346]|uniref:MBL fold metallo-hydrolase n=1 Tax=Actinoplanes sp. NPDC051346 TaxID=3155048 RepID=UPI0034224456